MGICPDANNTALPSQEVILGAPSIGQLLSILQFFFFREGCGEGGANLQRILDEITLTLFSLGTGQGITLKQYWSHLLITFGGLGVEAEQPFWPSWRSQQFLYHQHLMEELT